MTRHHVGPLAELSETEGARLEIGGQDIAIFRRGDVVFAIGDSCPHMGAALSEGFLDGDCVVCPWHGWTFRLDTGESPFEPDSRVPVYRAVVENGEVYVEVAEAPDPTACPPTGGQGC